MALQEPRHRTPGLALLASERPTEVMTDEKAAVCRKEYDAPIRQSTACCCRPKTDHQSG